MRAQGAFIDRPISERLRRGVGLALLVGQAPSTESMLRGINPRTDTLLGRAGRRIAKLADLTWFDYLRTFDRINLMSFEPETWPINVARGNAREIVELVECRPLILLGKRVASAFEIVDPKFHTNYGLAVGNTIIPSRVMPHPSGRSRYWNDPVNVAMAEKSWRDTVRGLNRCLDEARKAMGA